MNKNKGIAFAFITLLVVVFAVFGFVYTRQKSASTPPPSQLSEAEDDLDAIPTVGPEVKVELQSVVPKKEVKLVVSGVPEKTTSIEYEFTYSTKEQDSEGVFSTAKPKDSSYFPKGFERQITLGTCSRNVCRYHNVTSDIRVTLKFEGEYGARMYQHEFPFANL